MNRIEFMRQLEILLSDLSPQERSDALNFYNDYFDDAGLENEQRVLSELKSPREVSDKIKDGLNDATKNEGEFTENGYRDPRFQTYQSMSQHTTSNQENKSFHENADYENNANYNGNPYSNHSYQTNSQKPPLSGGKVAFIVILLLIASPVIIPLILSALGIFFSIILTLACLFIALAITSVALILAGIIVFGVGIVKLFIVPPAGVLVSGIGLILTAVGLLLLLLTVWICSTLLPALIRGFVALCRLPFQNRRKFA